MATALTIDLRKGAPGSNSSVERSRSRYRPMSSRNGDGQATISMNLSLCLSDRYGANMGSDASEFAEDAEKLTAVKIHDEKVNLGMAQGLATRNRRSDVDSAVLPGINIIQFIWPDGFWRVCGLSSRPGLTRGRSKINTNEIRYRNPIRRFNFFD